MHQKEARQEARRATVGIVLAAGKSKIKKKPKPLFPVNGQTMIQAAVAAQIQAGLDRVIVVVNPENKNLIRASLANFNGVVQTATQQERGGTADALHCALSHHWAKAAKYCLVSLGDMPFWQSNTLDGLIQAHALSKANHPGTITAVWHSACPKIFDHYGQIHFNEEMAPIKVEEYSANQNRTTWRGNWVSPCLWALTINAIADNLANCPKFANRDRAALPSESYLSSLVAAAHEANKPFQAYFVQNNAEEAIGINSWRHWQHYTRHHAQPRAL